MLVALIERRARWRLALAAASMAGAISFAPGCNDLAVRSSMVQSPVAEQVTLFDCKHCKRDICRRHGGYIKRVRRE